MAVYVQNINTQKRITTLQRLSAIGCCRVINMEYGPIKYQDAKKMLITYLLWTERTC